MPEVDKYFTVQPHTLLRQHLDYSHWYDRAKLTLKEVHNVQYVACMNPTAGSFTIDARLQRHFCVFALSFPGVEALKTIYCSILQQHLAGPGGFPALVQKMAPQVVDAALAFHNRIAQVFLPTAIKFHYVFNLRDLSNVFQGSFPLHILQVNFLSLIFSFLLLKFQNIDFKLSRNALRQWGMLQTTFGSRPFVDARMRARLLRQIGGKGGH